MIELKFQKYQFYHGEGKYLASLPLNEKKDEEKEKHFWRRKFLGKEIFASKRILLTEVHQH